MTGDSLDALTALPPTGLSAADAEWFDGMAACYRAGADATRNPLDRAENLIRAEAAETLASRLRDPAHRELTALPPVRNGERTLPDNGDIPMHAAERDAAYAVRHAPEMVQAEAGLERLALARNAGVLQSAVELGAACPTPDMRMLAHQLAAGRRLAMRLLSIADDDLTRHEKGRAMNLNPNAHAEATRSANAGARLMEACARSALALDRLRGGGRETRQHITVQHVTVTDGGQAVVAGSMAVKREESR